MPELPEVEVVRRGLERWVTGRRVESVTVLHPRAVRRHQAPIDLAEPRLAGVASPDPVGSAAHGVPPEPAEISNPAELPEPAEPAELSGPLKSAESAFPGAGDFAARLTGRTVTGTGRRGKYLWLPLDSGEVMLAHLGMSGQLLVGEPDRPAERHLRVRFTFTDDGLDLRFVDQRTFGHLLVAEPVGGVPGPVAHIAPDPLEDAFDDEVFAASLRRRHTGVKRALLDQSLISGVGNIYADEALWRARLHWARPTETLTKAEIARLLEAVREVMAAALDAGGTSFDSLYVNVNGESGYFDRSLDAYGRRDEPCNRCGTPIRRDVFMNRSSFSCPTCQPRPRRARL